MPPFNVDKRGVEQNQRTLEHLGKRDGMESYYVPSGTKFEVCGETFGSEVVPQEVAVVCNEGEGVCFSYIF